MTGTEIVGLVAVCGTMVALIVGIVYIGEYYLRKFNARSWERKRIYELQDGLDKLRQRYEHHEADRHERHR